MAGKIEQAWAVANPAGEWLSPLLWVICLAKPVGLAPSLAPVFEWTPFSEEVTT